MKVINNVNYIVMATHFSRYSVLTQLLTPSLHLLFKGNHVLGGKNACHQKGQGPLYKIKLLHEMKIAFSS